MPGSATICWRAVAMKIRRVNIVHCVVPFVSCVCVTSRSALHGWSRMERCPYPALSRTPSLDTRQLSPTDSLRQLLPTESLNETSLETSTHHEIWRLSTAGSYCQRTSLITRILIKFSRLDEEYIWSKDVRDGKKRRVESRSCRKGWFWIRLLWILI